MFLPVTIVIPATFVGLAYQKAWRNAPFLLYSSMPEQTTSCLYLAMILDISYFLSATCSAFFVEIALLLFFLKFNDQVKTLAGNLNRRLTCLCRIRQAYLDIRMLQLTLQFFNMGYSYHIFVGKIFCITNSIILTAYGIMVLEKEHVVAVMSMFLGLGYSLFYISGSENAFHIQIGINKCKRKISAAAGLLRSGRIGYVRS
ncbi:unnamed protein product, partial [Allacma fusca]